MTTRLDDRSVVDILRARVARASRAPHGDGASVALAVEGGAMRGVISAGMISALEELGYIDAFDAVYGSSAGAINAAYFLAGQARLGTRIYHEDINTRAFIDFGRALRGRPIVNLGFLLDDVARDRKKLDVTRVLESATPLWVLATDVAECSARAFGPFDNAELLFGALRAGATMPVIAGEPHDYVGKRYLDASLTEPIPVPTAELGGHSHILALLTRSGGMRPDVSAFDRYFVGPRLRRLSPELARRYLNRAAPYTELVRAMEGGLGPLGRARVLGVRVEDLRISKLERRREILELGARRGYAAVRALFG
ncbi:MAG: patatin-like phospholipase family protein [Vicinamibacterales bacterium]